MQDFEKLGVFFLGRRFDEATSEPQDDLLLYDSKDLVTHAVCVGMTGSGKTGLCLALLEEAAIDGIPAIVIDPKGDLGNLLLTFPDLAGKDFEPWVNEEDARKKKMTVRDFAANQAETWKKGLAEWGQDGARIQMMRDAADMAIYTPGSSAGLPVSVLKSFAAPSDEVIGDSELFRDRIAATVTSLLGLLGIQADPIQSREHILLANILASKWKNGDEVTLGELVQLIQTPPIQRIGVVDLESFYPAKERFTLSMLLNNLLASPGFEAWMEGEPLDVGAMLHSADGKPRISIFSISHLSDAERMFFVSLLLNQVLSWVRTQPGTTSLRAIVYMDEIFGYFPPIANPPSKKPLLTLLKQARAYGLGVVLATQNPVDLDYKGLSNAGTWFIGRLQTERDKARVLEGLEGAASGAGAKFDRGRMEQTLAGLGNRVFLMNNVHENEPTVFQVRWVMSYLRGPLTRTQIKKLMDGRKASARDENATPTVPPTAVMPVASEMRPVLPPEVAQVFLPIRSTAPDGTTLAYRPALLGSAKTYFVDPKMQVDHAEELILLTEFSEGVTAVNWADADELNVAEADLEREPDDTARYTSPPAAVAKAKSFDAWKRSLADHLFRSRKLDILYCVDLEQYSKAGESERDFRVRMQQVARELRDGQADQLRAKYGPKVATLEERIRRAKQAVDREAEQSRQSRFSALLSAGATVLSAVFGRKTLSVGNVGKAATTMRGAGRAMKESADVGRAEENVKALEQQLLDLDAQMQEELQSLEAKADPMTVSLETKSVKPKKTNISVRLVALAWVPYWQQQGGDSTPAWR